MDIDFSRHLHMAHGQISGGDWKGAKQSLLLLLQKRPQDPGLLLHLSQVESMLGAYRNARMSAVDASRRRSDDPRVMTDLVRRLRVFNEAHVLQAYVRQWQPAALTIPVLLAFAAQLSYLGQQEHALALLDEARRADPDYPPTLVSRAQVLIYLGRFKAAQADLVYCTRRAPGLGQAWWLLARVSSALDAPAQVDALYRRLAAGGMPPREVAFFQSALHLHLDRLGDHAAAWQALHLACVSMRTQLRHDPAQVRELFDALAARRPRPPLEAAEMKHTPIFIVGLHRSGTTLLEQLLDGHDQVQALGEMYDFTSQLRWATDHHCRGTVDAHIVRSEAMDLATVGAGYLQGVGWRLGEARYFTDKLPSNLLNVGLICEALPQAKILRMVRDPVETCFSNLRELFSDVNPWSYDPLEMAQYHRQSDVLAAHWHRAYPGRILDVDYAALTRTPEAVLQQVASFCGLDYQPGMLEIAQRTRAVATASAVQAREGITALDVPKWYPYRVPLAPMIAALQE